MATPDQLDGDEAADILTLDPDKSTVVSAFGRKGSGKSYLTTALWRDYPYDRLLIDNTGDVDPHGECSDPWPGGDRWPDPPDPGGRGSWRLRPNRRDPDWRLDVDKAIGAAMDHGRVGIDVDEAGQTFPVNRVAPNADDMLHTLRHRNVSLFAAAPRPVGIDTLVLTQSDLVAMFQTPHEIDQKRLAATLGLPERELATLLRQLDDHEFLLFDSNAYQLYHCDPIP